MPLHASATSSSRPVVRLAIACVACLISLVGGCSAPQRTFDTPEAAVDALVSTLRTDDRAELKRILGSDADDVLSSGDAVADRNARTEFLRTFDESHRLVADGGDAMILEVGASAWPMPIPVVKGDAGWFFDTEAGLDELLSRRIGRNELDVIQVSLAIVDAQREFAARDLSGSGLREYARQFRSDPGKRNGLYWPSRPGEPESPLGELVADAQGAGYRFDRGSRPQPFHGYYFRILTAQGPSAPGGAMDYIARGHMIGGFGVVAWPADYGNSGIKTFIVSGHGVLYERDLGEDTDRIARDMRAFDPGPGWTRIADAWE